MNHKLTSTTIGRFLIPIGTISILGLVFLIIFFIGYFQDVPSILFFGPLNDFSVLLGYLNSSGGNIPFLLLFGFLAGTSYTATNEGVVWPIAHAVLPPELRGSNRAIISIVVGAASALALSLSGVVVDSQGVTNALLCSYRV